MYDKVFEDTKYKQMLTDNNITYATTWDEVNAYSNEGRLIATLTDDFFEKQRRIKPDTCTDDRESNFTSERNGRRASF